MHSTSTVLRIRPSMGASVPVRVPVTIGPCRSSEEPTFGPTPSAPGTSNLRSLRRNDGVTTAILAGVTASVGLLATRLTSLPSPCSQRERTRLLSLVRTIDKQLPALFELLARPDVTPDARQKAAQLTTATSSALIALSACPTSAETQEVLLLARRMHSALLATGAPEADLIERQLLAESLHARGLFAPAATVYRNLADATSEARYVAAASEARLRALLCRGDSRGARTERASLIEHLELIEEKPSRRLEALERDFEEALLPSSTSVDGARTSFRGFRTRVFEGERALDAASRQKLGQWQSSCSLWNRELHAACRDLAPLLDAPNTPLKHAAIERQQAIAARVDAARKSILEEVTTVMSCVRARLLAESPISEDDARKLASVIEIKGADSYEGILREQLAEFFPLSGARGLLELDRVTLVDERSTASVHERTLRLRRDGGSESLYHELGHFLEWESEEVRAAAHEWLRSRADSKDLIDLKIAVSSLYRDGEVAYAGAFVHPYVGRNFGPDAPTEVISMGIERFRSAEEMAKFFVADPEHFLLTLAVLTDRG